MINHGVAKEHSGGQLQQAVISSEMNSALHFLPQMETSSAKTFHEITNVHWTVALISDNFIVIGTIPSFTLLI